MLPRNLNWACHEDAIMKEFQKLSESQQRVLREKCGARVICALCVSADMYEDKANHIYVEWRDTRGIDGYALTRRGKVLGIWRHKTGYSKRSSFSSMSNRLLG